MKPVFGHFALQACLHPPLDSLAEDSMSPLAIAAGLGNLEMLRCLLSAKALASDTLALHIATERNHLPVVRCLMEAQASSKSIKERLGLRNWKSFLGRFLPAPSVGHQLQVVSLDGSPRCPTPRLSPKPSPLKSSPKMQRSETLGRSSVSSAPRAYFWFDFCQTLLSYHWRRICVSCCFLSSLALGGIACLRPSKFEQSGN